MEDSTPYPTVLLKLARTRMPFGSYKGCLLIDLPKPCVIWFAKKGLPEGLYLATSEDMPGLVAQGGR
ncbi:MAG: DUF3820 family protein [Deltaproteobacteria bacterium]|nr:DUF3820 family protein [Deltaproteobacteria bacterium]MBW2078696.1 DUF3820 family protein [Deltaproteobacteria bacterium]MBW2312455.1 DUF3820 family protein [Deltaproteobacteria bacterium]